MSHRRTPSPSSSSPGSLPPIPGKRSPVGSPVSVSPSKRFKVAPSSMEAPDFALIHPLISLRTREDRQAANNVDKFCFGKMDEQALRAFFAWGPGRHIKRTLETFDKSSGDESKYRAALCQLFPPFKMLSEGRARLLDLKEAKTEEGDDAIEEEHGSQGSSQSPILQRVIHESGEGLEGGGKVDFLLQVFTKNTKAQIMKSAEEFGEDPTAAINSFKAQKEGWINVAAIDGKGCTLIKSWSDKYCYQLGCYGNLLAIDNCRKGYVRPLNLLALSDTDWRLATLDPFGIVEVKDNQITPQSWDAFEGMQEKRFAWFKKKGAPETVMLKPMKQESVQRMLNVGVKNLKSQGYIGVSDGNYVVGFYYVDQKRYSWDGNISDLSSKSPISNGTLRLMEGLLRLFVGEKVVKWTREDVLEFLAQWEKDEKRWCEDKEN